MGIEEERAKDGNGSIGKIKIVWGPLIDASEMHSPRGHLVIPLLLGKLPAQPHPSQINGCLSTQETTSYGNIVQPNSIPSPTPMSLKTNINFFCCRSHSWLVELSSAGFSRDGGL